ncbi:Transposon Tf2-6 polyprotein [Caligus rogercresseyi]|uniref:RNA-directed DNA polymerase n=1 Tax=Caligus rogercresseyi TaxID=217165 RepID=A0A7T8GU86_CALRO|nr:Transposon Tf2-6 polyprotein [Caligus rogercresseyi]
MPNTRSEGAMKEEDQTPTDPVQLMMAMMKEMKEEAKKREDQLMRQLQEQAQDFAAALQTNRGNAGGSTKSKKMDVPVLKCPEDINLADFRDWQQRFADYTEVQKIMEECTLSGRQSLLRSGLDPAWTKLWSTGILEIDDRKDDINDIIKKILHYIREHRNPLLDRKEFLERNQHAGESIDVYYSALKSIDESCGYDVNPTCKVCDDACGHGDELQQERLRDRLICGLKDQAIQQKVLAIPFKDLTLKKALEVCRVEAASKETQASLNKSERQVNRLKERSSYKKGKIDNNPLSKSAQKADERCSNCGRKKHQKPDQCWARDKDCNNCGKTGHLKHMCRSEPKKEVNRMTIGQVKTSDDLVKITAKIGNADHQEVEWLPDTGAECDVITADCLKKVGTKVKDLRKDKAELCGPDQGRLKSLGKVTATLEREGMKYKTELHVLEKGTGPILSKVGCTALGLIPTGWPHVVNKLSLSSPDEGNGVDMLLKSQSAASIREQLFQEFPEVFPPDDEVLPLKPMKGPPMKIELLPGTSPIRRYRCNTIPLHAFSRYPVSEPTEDDLEGDEEMEKSVKLTLNAVSLQDPKLEEVRLKTETDPVLLKLKEVIVDGFPEHKANLDTELRDYWGIRDKLSIVDGLIMYGSNRIVIPTSLRRQVLDELHAAHQGRERMLQLARQSVHWPRIHEDLSNLSKGCDDCATHKASQAKEPLVQDEQPSRPGEAVAADLFLYEGREYLVITDKYSGWPEVYDCGKSGVNTKDVEKAIARWMAALGVPVRLTTDGGPQFKGEAFKEFCRRWGILHDPSSPYHHIANGYAEAAVKSMKSLVKKVSPDVRSSKFFKALLTYRNTPRSDGLSPAERLYGRPARTSLPAHPVVYNRTDRDRVIKADRKAVSLRAKAKAAYDVGSKELSELKVGDIVRVQHGLTKKWNLIAEVLEIRPRGRSYLVKTESGRLYWRNRRYLKLYAPPIGVAKDIPESQEEVKQPRRSKRQKKAPVRFQP